MHAIVFKCNLGIITDIKNQRERERTTIRELLQKSECFLFKTTKTLNLIQLFSRHIAIVVNMCQNSKRG